MWTMRLFLTVIAQQAVGAGVRVPPVWVTALEVCETREAAFTDRRFLAAGACRAHSLEDVDPQRGEIWGRAQVKLPSGAERSARPFFVLIDALASSTVYWNGQFVGANGTPSLHARDERPGRLEAAFYLRPEQLRRMDNELVVQLSAWHNPLHVETPMHAIGVGPFLEPGLARARAYIPALVMAGALLLMVAYFVVVFLRDRTNRTAMHVAVMGVSATAQLGFEVSRVFVPIAYPTQVWRLLGVAACAATFGLTLVAYVARRFAPQTVKRWTLVAGIAAVASYALPGFDGLTYGILVSSAAIALGVTAAAGWRRQRGARLIAVALALFLLLAAVDPFTFLDRGFYIGVAVLGVILLVDQAALHLKAQAAARHAATRASLLELELLRRRMAPHWLMNTLNAVVSWIESEPRTAIRMVESLAEEFRLVSRLSERPDVSLGEELELCERHLEVMSLRVDRAFRLECAGVDVRLRVPPGVIHTLLENAFTHGRYQTGAVFTLSQDTTGDGIRLTFGAPAPEDRPPKPHAGGDGLAYVARRLQAVFGDTARLGHGPDADGGWTTTMTFTPAHS